MKNTKIFCLTPSEPGEPAFQSWLHKKWPIQNGENEPLLSSRLNARIVENFNVSENFRLIQFWITKILIFSEIFRIIQF